MLDYAGLLTQSTGETMPKEPSALMRVNLNPDERHQLKIKAAKANKPVSHFVADHLRESLRLKRAARK